MFKMFKDTKPEKPCDTNVWTQKNTSFNAKQEINSSSLNELKIGKIAQNVLMPMLESGLATTDEISWMQNADYSKQFFHINYPLLVSADRKYDKARYYAKILVIYGKKYVMCNDWYEKEANDDRPYLLRWIAKHQKPNTSSGRSD